MSLQFESLDNHTKSVRNYTAPGTAFKVEMTNHTHYIQTKSTDEHGPMRKEDKYVDIKICGGVELEGLDMNKIKVLRGALARAADFLIGADDGTPQSSPFVSRASNSNRSPMDSELNFLE